MLDDITTIRAAGNALRSLPLVAASEREPSTIEWLYLPGDYEAGLIDRLVREGRAASRFVEFAENYQGPVERVAWRLATGRSGRLFTSAGISARALHTRLEEVGGGWWEVTSSDGNAPEVELRGGGTAATAGVPRGEGSAWEVAGPSGEWAAPDRRLGGDTPAHEAGEPIVPLQARPIGGGIWEFPLPVLGRVLLDGAEAPAIVTGESLAELDSDAPHELRFDVASLGNDSWTTVHEVCGRYLRANGPQPSSVTIRARSRHHDRVGAFACSDERLNAIWQASALTLHLCMQGLVIDGLKRDRMPWSGDQALNTVSNSFAFGDGSIVRDGLVALGRPTHGYINGISDYSLWWLVNAAQYVTHFGDASFAREYADHLDGFLAGLAEDVAEDGLFHPRTQEDGFVGAGPGSVFIDWGFEVPADGPSGALQILWYWALSSGASLLASAGHSSSGKWNELTDRLRATLTKRAWRPEDRRWATVLDRAHDEPSAHPNLFAVLSGLDGNPAPAVLDAIRDGAVGTPFMRGFALSALAQGGRSEEAVEEIKARWGEMLDAGPGTMWEEFVGEEPYAMYGRPFAKSLCHAWASGPAALLPEILLGLRPTGDGWTEAEVSPNLGALDWAAAVVPTRHGDLAVSASRDRLVASVPAGMRLTIEGKVVTGPARIDTATGR